MYGISPAPFPFRRADVVTRRDRRGARPRRRSWRRKTPSDERAAAWAATRALVRAMNEAGVRHHDLNVKNVLLAPSEGGLDGVSAGRGPRDVRSAAIGGGGAGQRRAAAPLRAEVARPARRAVRRERARGARRTADDAMSEPFVVAVEASRLAQEVRGIGREVWALLPRLLQPAADAAARAVDPASGGRRRRAETPRGARRAARPRALRAAPPPGPRARGAVLVSVERVAAGAAARRGGGDDPGRRADSCSPTRAGGSS